MCAAPALLAQPDVLFPELLTANIAVLTRVQGRCPALGPLPDTMRVSMADTALSVEMRSDERWQVIDGLRLLEETPDWLAPLDRYDVTQAIIVGVGLGYPLDRLASSGLRRILAIEPDPGLATLLLSRRDWRAWFAEGRLRLLTGPDYRGSTDVSRFLDGLAEVPVVASPSRTRSSPDAMARAAAVAERVVQNARSNGNARRKFAGPYLLQTLANLPVISREGDVDDLAGAFAGVPAVVVGAGPSLDDNLPDVRAWQDRALIVAADTALGPLLAGGVRPHIAVGADSSALNARHLTEAGAADDVWLVAEGSLHPSAFPAFAGRAFVFRVADHEPWPWLRGAGVSRGELRTWGSVLTSAFDLARRMGCDPLVFAGADLAYTGMRPYCRGTIYDGIWQTWIDAGCTREQLTDDYFSRQPDVRQRDVRGALTRTASHFVSFRDWLIEQMAAHPGVRYINATGHGILHGAPIRQATLQDALAGLPGRPALRDTLRARHDGSRARSRGSASLNGLLARARRAPGGLPLARWVRFTADTVTAPQIVEQLPASVG